MKAYREVDMQTHVSATLALVESEQFHDPTALPLGKSPHHQTHRIGGWWEQVAVWTT
jgi:hypothetical protein